ncbi:MAG: DUF1289 domain-containing protein [Gammaproteobacteria bacterium]
MGFIWRLRLNDDDICLGCFRTLAEITQWGQADDDTRQNVLLKAEQRRKAHNEI